MKGLARRRADKWMEKHKKSELRYDIRLFDNRQFFLEFTMKAPSDIITKLAKWMAQRQGTDVFYMDKFSVDERLHTKMLTGFKKSITEVEKKTAKDIPGFGIIHMKIDDCTYEESAPSTYDVHIKISGDYAITDPLK